MKVLFRHAATLALMGWYLMVPPITDQGQVELDVPMLQWQQADVFDAASACQHEKENELVCDAAIISRGTASDINHSCGFAAGTTPRIDDVIRLAARFRLKRYAHALCVASDDPRLKGN